jgi:glycosyltransferase involved in cell wall biosynthesis
MNIAIDARAIRERRTGVENTLLNFLDFLSRGAAPHRVVVLREKDKSFALERPGGLDVIDVRTGWPPGFYFHRLPKILDAVRADVYYSIWTAFPPFARARKIVTVHDLAWVHFPEAYRVPERLRYRAWMRLAARYGDTLIAVSENTRNDVVALHPGCESKVRVIRMGFRPDYLAPGETPHPLPPQVRDFLKGGDYVLSVGTLHPRKNLKGLIRAFFLYKDRYDDPVKLVIAGVEGGAGVELGALLLGSPRGRDVLLAGYVGDEDLKALYRGARTFVLPSFYEGFGLPVLEAMASGTPVAAARSSCLPEIAGDAALYFRPEDPAEMADAMALLCRDETLRRKLIEKGLERVKQFDTEEAARALWALLTESGRAKLDKTGFSW